MRINLIATLTVAAFVLGFAAAPVLAEAPAEGKGSVKGKITYPDGTAGVGVTVQLVRRERAKPSNEGAPAEAGKGRKAKGAGKVASVAESIADQSGEFAMADVPAGRYALVCRLKGVGAARQPVSVTAGETTSVTLKLVARDAAKKPGKANKPGKARKQPAANQ